MAKVKERTLTKTVKEATKEEDGRTHGRQPENQTKILTKPKVFRRA